MIYIHDVSPAPGTHAVTKLHFLVEEGDPAVAQAAIDAGADLQSLDPWGYSPLLLAASNNEPSAVQLPRIDGACRRDTDVALAPYYLFIDQIADLHIIDLTKISTC